MPDYDFTGGVRGRYYQAYQDAQQEAILREAILRAQLAAPVEEPNTRQFGTTRVGKEALLAKLKDNKAKHRKIFEEASVGYREQVIEEFDRLLQKAKAGNRVPSTIHFTQPVDQTPEYDRAITMLEMSLDEFFILDQNQFDSYVMDRWQWKQQFLSANKMYSTTAMAESRAMGLDDDD